MFFFRERESWTKERKENKFKRSFALVGPREIKSFGGGGGEARCLFSIHRVCNGIIFTHKWPAFIFIVFHAITSIKHSNWNQKCWQPIRKSENSLSFLFENLRKSIYTIALIVRFATFATYEKKKKKIRQKIKIVLNVMSFWSAHRFEMLIMPMATPNWFRSNYTSIGKQTMFGSEEQIRCVCM